MTEEQARKIGGKQGVIISIYLCIFIFVIFVMMMLSDGISNLLLEIKQIVERPERFHTSNFPFLIALLLISFFYIIWLGYIFGKKAGHSIFLKDGNYLSIGWWSMFKTILTSSILTIYTMCLLMMPYDSFSSFYKAFNNFELFWYFSFAWLIFIFIFGLPLSLIGLWLGNKIENERIKHLSPEHQESNLSE